ncbi:MAG: IS200/IS605 family transposase [Acidobacteria bacterium]|nr:MAG: IS200/IS605 family transposase [Acidobacteriota bacterium]REJ99135.1 MAG: IS200/IS605 family transposase [Acidobacteriota bacterium]REK16144.1 MAG: IS200/IS605 family transposase [Acidobacteriota bacterium]REK43825.1 MAG: IS200/IS605 family transposase [Acidobacteriota bacterium]
MPNTYSSHFFHIVFSTKNRRRLITQEIEKKIWTFISGSVKRAGATPLRVGGYDDHIHVLMMAKPSSNTSKIVQQIKGESSRWISQTFENRRTFKWQDGYASFTVSRSALSSVEAYIKNQRSHHSRMGFEDEYRKLLDLHDVDIVDEKYLFG